MPPSARNGGLELDRARARFAGLPALLLQFGRLADQAALSNMDLSGSVRDRLFDLIMRRIDFLQRHRAGVIALLRGLPRDPVLSLMLTTAGLRSMVWLLEASGVSAGGLAGMLRAQGLMAVWLWTVRAWQRDESADLSGTMAALDTALTRAEQAAGWLPGGGGRSAHEQEVADEIADLVEDDALPETVVYAPPDAPASPPV